MRRLPHAGFTLIEILVVLVILGILAGVVAPKLLSYPDKARVSKAQQEIASIAQSLSLYKLDNMRYPTMEQGLAALAVKPTTEPQPTNWQAYLPSLPKDPWGNPYQYSLNTAGEPVIVSLGADGKPGGSDSDADISSAQNH